MTTADDEVKQAAEMICSALFQMEFEFLGEPNQLDTWWGIGTERGRQVRVRVRRDFDKAHPRVVTKVEWVNTTSGELLHFHQELVVQPVGKTKAQYLDATGLVVHRCLEIFHDVLGQTGVAGPDYVKSSTKQ